MKHWYLVVGVAALMACSCNSLRAVLGGEQPVSSRIRTPAARLITEIPFVQFTGGVIILRGRVNDFPDTLNFILDTGSGGISLDSTTCDRLGLKVEPSDRFIRGIGGMKKLFYAGGNTLVLPGLTIDSLNFHISNYDFISSVYGVQIDGIIGYSFLKDYIVRVNYDSMKLFVYSPGGIDYGKSGELLHTGSESIPVISAPLKNKDRYHMKYYFDMGAGLCLMISNRFVNDSCLFCGPRKQKHRFIQSEAQGLTGKITMTQTVVQGLQVGKYYFHNVPTYLFDDVSNVTAYPRLGGLVGNDLLRRFNVTLNYPAGEIYLAPNSHFKDPFDYSYTGLVMYFIDGQVQITEVNKGSPAAKAGLRPGDVIVSVGSNFSNNIQQYRELLKAAGRRTQLIIRRDGQLLQMKMRIQSIL